MTLAHPPSDSTPRSTRPFFIVGSGRSGSTLLRLILAGHPRITIPPETWFLLDVVDEIPLTGTLDGAEVERAASLMRSYYRWADLGIGDAEFETAVAALEAPTLRDLADLVYSIYLEREGADRWGDKTPTYVRILPEIATLYPEALFIHLVRDGRDVAHSMHKRRWKGRWLVENAVEWREAIDCIAEARTWLGPDRLLEVRYEDLVRDVEGVTREICRFLGEAYDPGMLRWEESIESKVPGREMEIHQKLFRRPRASDAGVWASDLSPGQVFALESILGDRLEGQGYALRFGGPAWAGPRSVLRCSMPLLPVLDIALRTPGAILRRLRWAILGRGQPAASD